MTGNALAEDARQLVIADHGAVAPASNAANQPDPGALQYRVAFSVTKAAAGAMQVNPRLEKVARFVNLLGSAQVRARPGEIVAIIHGPATPFVLSDCAWRARFG